MAIHCLALRARTAEQNSKNKAHGTTIVAWLPEAVKPDLKSRSFVASLLRMTAQKSKNKPTEPKNRAVVTRYVSRLLELPCLRVFVVQRGGDSLVKAVGAQEIDGCPEEAAEACAGEHGFLLAVRDNPSFF